MKQEDFEKLPEEARQAEIDRYNNTDREWYSHWPKCNHRINGKMAYLRGLTECPVCHGK